MGRIVKRVPLKFDWLLGKVWFGYQDPLYWCEENSDLDEELKEKYSEMFRPIEPPRGKGYQLWETTTEGSPSSPVFTTLDELCEWCEKNGTTFANFNATKDEWRRMLEQGMIYHREDNAIFS